MSKTHSAFSYAFRTEHFVESNGGRVSRRKLLKLVLGTIVIAMAALLIVTIFNREFREPTVGAWVDCGDNSSDPKTGCLAVRIEGQPEDVTIDACNIERIHEGNGGGGCSATEVIALHPDKMVHIAVSQGASKLRIVLYEGQVKADKGVKMSVVDEKLDARRLDDDALTHGSRYFSFRAPSSPPGTHYAEVIIWNGDYQRATVPFFYRAADST